MQVSGIWHLEEAYHDMLELDILEDVPFRALRIAEGTLLEQPDANVASEREIPREEETVRPSKTKNIPVETQICQTEQEASREAADLPAEQEDKTPADRASITESKSLRKDYRIYLKSFGIANLGATAVLIATHVAIEKANRKQSFSRSRGNRGQVVTSRSAAFFLSHWAGAYQNGDTSRPPGFYIGLFSLLVAMALIVLVLDCWYGTYLIEPNQRPWH